MPQTAVKKNISFTSRDLLKLIFPLVVEQFLAIAVGLCDSLMVASVGEAAGSAVSLVDTVNILLISAFTALATGGAIVAGQYLGRREPESAGKAAEQLLFFMLVLSLAITCLLYLFKNAILGGLFGQIDADVMVHCNTYYLITEASIPFLALYSAGAALFRVMGNSAVSMKISFIMNGINIAGNALMIYGLHAGVEGVAVPTLVSRIVAAAAVFPLLRNQNLPVHLPKGKRFTCNRRMIRNIVSLGIPNGIENSLFQLGKILLLSVASAFGTASIAANAVGNNIASFQILAAQAIGVGMVTVVSQCVGAQDFAKARAYTRKLMIWAYIAGAVSNVIILLILPGIISAYNISAEAGELAGKIVWMHGIMAMIFWPMSFTLPQSIKAAGDTKFTMIVASVSMWVFRVLFGVWFARDLNFGVLGIWMAMFIDWFVRIAFFVVRYRGHKWEQKFLRG